MRTVIDFSGIPSNDPVPAGDYPVEVENVEWRQSKDKIDKETGELSEYWNWEAVITDGPFQGRRLFFMTSLTKSALWKLRNVLVNLGAYRESIEPVYDEDTKQVLEPELVGLTGVARVKMGSYKGEPRSEVDKILDDDGVDREKAMRQDAKSNGKADAPGKQRSFLSKQRALADAEGADEGDVEPVAPVTGPTRKLDRADMKLR